MMRSKFITLSVLAALALPLGAQAFGRRGAASDCDSCGSGGRRGGALSALLDAIAASNSAPVPSGRSGLGLLQPPFQAAPWYLYWPYDQHFQLPAPINAPYHAPQNLHTPWNPYFAQPAGGPWGDPRFGPINDPRFDQRFDQRNDRRFDQRNDAGEPAPIAPPIRP